jgi:hypothetical protein
LRLLRAAGLRERLQAVEPVRGVPRGPLTEVERSPRTPAGASFLRTAMFKHGSVSAATEAAGLHPIPIHPIPKGSQVGWPWKSSGRTPEARSGLMDGARHQGPHERLRGDAWHWAVRILPSAQAWNCPAHRLQDRHGPLRVHLSLFKADHVTVEYDCLVEITNIQVSLNNQSGLEGSPPHPGCRSSSNRDSRGAAKSRKARSRGVIRRPPG